FCRGGFAADARVSELSGGVRARRSSNPARAPRAVQSVDRGSEPASLQLPRLDPLSRFPTRLRVRECPPAEPHHAARSSFPLGLLLGLAACGGGADPASPP